jgi:hypothetical protein
VVENACSGKKRHATRKRHRTNGKHEKALDTKELPLAIPAGFEPATLRVEI